MMRNILVPLSSGFVDEPAFEAALLIARRMNSHIRALYVRPDPAAAIRYIPDVIAAAGVTREIIERESHEAAMTEHDRFEAWARHHDLGTSPPMAPHHGRRCASWAEHRGDIEQLVTRFGRVSDLIVMSRYEPGDVMAVRCFDAAVFGSGRPTLITPKHLPCNLLEHVLIAWNGSLEASHAVFAALPLLQVAGRVSIFTVPEAGRGNNDGTELMEALLWNRIRASSIGRPPEPGPAGTALLAMASCGVSLLVMGAYTHSRLRQSILGGVTRQVLAEATMPVLMCH